MPFISRRAIPLEVRQPFEQEYRAKLRQALNDPSTPEAKKADIRRQLDRLKALPRGEQ